MASAELLGDIRYFVPSCPNIGGCIPGIPGGVDAYVQEASKPVQLRARRRAGLLIADSDNDRSDLRQPHDSLMTASIAY
jgi:hypothetical protein